MKSSLLMLCAIPIAFAGCHLFGGGDYPPLDVVPSVDLARYLGKWYEIASVPVPQQKGCYCTTAEYSLIDEGTIRVVNSCRKGGPEGEVSSAEGKAFVVPNSNNAKLRVQFFWPFRGDYWILRLDPDYRYAVVGTPSREYFWILSREPRMEESVVGELLAQVGREGFDTTKVQRTTHSCP